MTTHGRVLGTLHRGLSRSRSIVFLAAKLRNQCGAIIANRVSDGPDLDRNGELWAIEQVAPASRFFVDVGANVGEWARAFATRMRGEPKGLLVEASPEAASVLRSNMRVAGLPSLEIVQLAAGDKVSECAFFMEPNLGKTSSMVQEHSVAHATKIAVRGTTLDRELLQRRIEFVDFLKIDAEGLDLNVLFGSKQYLIEQKIGVVQFEYNYPWQFANATLRSAFQILQNWGYRVYLLKREGLFEFSPNMFGEYYAYSNFIAYVPSISAKALDSSVKHRL